MAIEYMTVKLKYLFFKFGIMVYLKLFFNSS
nr:MAG TPA: hypothetical protein [Caudoviricetes sp.]